jgi:hypothetical protein
MISNRFSARAKKSPKPQKLFWHRTHALFPYSPSENLAQKIGNFDA